MKVKKARKTEEHRLEEERRDEEDAQIEREEVARLALESASSIIGLTFKAKTVDGKLATEVVDRFHKDVETKIKAAGSTSSRDSRHSRTSSVAVADLNSAMLSEMYHGPKTRPSQIIMIDGKMMSESDATQYVNDFKANDEQQRQRGSFGGSSEVSKTFSFLNHENEDDDDDEMKQQEIDLPRVCQVEINLQIPTPSDVDIEECFGEKIDNTKNGPE